MTQATDHARFVARVRAEMDVQKLSVRALARRMDPDNLDRARRNLHRWLDGEHSPHRTSRVEVALALGIPVSELQGEVVRYDEFAQLGDSLAEVLRQQVSSAVAAVVLQQREVAA